MGVLELKPGCRIESNTNTITASTDKTSETKYAFKINFDEDIKTTMKKTQATKKKRKLANRPLTNYLDLLNLIDETDCQAHKATSTTSLEQSHSYSHSSVPQEHTIVACSLKDVYDLEFEI